MLDDETTEHRARLVGPRLKTFARLHSELAIRDEAFEKGRRTWPALDITQNDAMDREGKIGADEVRVFERAKHGKPPPKACLHDGIDCCRIADASLDQRNRFTPERMLKPVSDEAGDVLFH